jgi:malonyl-CoA/methylmalonyl-CoA synthetase
VAFLTPPGMDYVATQWGVWRAGGIAVPLCVLHPEPELAYVIDDSQASIVVAHPEYEASLRPVAETRGLRFLTTTELSDAEPGRLPEVESSRRAMMVYTSGTTDRPKGAVTTHATIAAQIRSLVEAWAWTAEDHILHVLPLHHVHGIVNVLCCALWSGATCEFLPKFDAARVWERFIDGSGLTLFMAVPTVYARLIAEWESAAPERREAMRAGCERLRLMVSGSAALPVPMLEKWRSISGHTLLERYGMTEIGMGLSNPLHGERKPGHVGRPLPGVEIRLRGEDDRPVPDGTPGEIQVAGPCVFQGYWQRPEVTQEAFTDDGWFRSGDVAVREDGIYRILGRSSVDIIKTGGYKVSALEVEDVLRTHASIGECAVVGIEDPEWGQRVAAAVIPAPGHRLDLESLRAWGKDRMATYKVPSLLLLVDALPRNPMGKVTKPEVVKLFEQDAAGTD